MMDETVAHEGWRMRPVLLGLLGGAAGLLAHRLLGNGYGLELTALQAAALAFVTVAPGLLGFTLERVRSRWSLVFALAGGLVAAGIIYWSGPTSGWDDAAGWRVFSLFLAIVIAAPLFQAARDAGAARFAYPAVHDHAWTDIVLWCASWAFVGVTVLLTVLLSELFHLIRIDLLKNLLEENLFQRVLVGGAFGTGLGVLREQDALVRLLRKVVTTVLAVLAPVLAVGLALFVLALPFTGLDALWEATRNTTPILLGCVVGALVLANVVIGNGPDEEARNPALRYAAMALAAVMLPLAVIAAVATGLRIGQHGFTPERLWALTFVIVATAVGLAYLVSLVRGRLGWAAKVRPANLNIAFGVCALALVLATPLISFNAISTRDQVARLESGKLTVDQFDWRALAFDFGKPGRDALAKLKGSANAAIREKAGEALAAKSSREFREIAEAEELAGIEKRVRILPQPIPLTRELRWILVDHKLCGDPDERCTMFVFPGGQQAVAFRDSCGRPRGGTAANFNWQCGNPVQMSIVDGKWSAGGGLEVVKDDPAADPAAKAALQQGYRDGQIEVRPVQRRQVFVGGVPVGDAFE